MSYYRTILANIPHKINKIQEFSSSSKNPENPEQDQIAPFQYKNNVKEVKILPIKKAIKCPKSDPKINGILT